MLTNFHIRKFRHEGISGGYGNVDEQHIEQKTKLTAASGIEGRTGTNEEGDGGRDTGELTSWPKGRAVFACDPPSKQAFWMRETRIPLSIRVQGCDFVCHRGDDAVFREIPFVDEVGKVCT
jgi:hypothetical protein